MAERIVAWCVRHEDLGYHAINARPNQCDIQTFRLASLSALIIERDEGGRWPLPLHLPVDPISACDLLDALESITVEEESSG